MDSQSDLIEFACPGCGARFKTAIANAGKRIRCRKCEQSLQVPFAGRVEPELDEVLVVDSTKAADPAQPLPEPADPIQFDFDSVDIDTILADAKRAEEEAARLVEQQKALQAKAEQLRRENRQSPKQSISKPAESSAPSARGIEAERANLSRSSETEQVDITYSKSVEMPAVDGDELLGHVDEIAAPKTGNAREREDLAPLAVEGITSDEVDVDELYGVRCSVCDTRIHITPDKIGTQIECPICYSPVEVTAPSPKPRYRPDWNQPRPKIESEGESGELRLSPPVERPKVEPMIEPGFGLPDVEEDLLAPLEPREERMEEADEIPELQVIEKAETDMAGRSVRKPPRYPKNVGSDQPGQPPSPGQTTANRNANENRRTSRRARLEDSQVEDQERPLSVHSPDDLERLTVTSLHQHVVAMVTDPRMIIPAVTSIIMLTVGDLLYDVFQDLRGPDAEAGFGNAIKLILSGFSYLAIYGGGTMILWYICGILFRESARGSHRIESWRPRGFEEMKSTFLLFAFSFALAGSPFLMLGTCISAPLRMLIAPLPLLVAWFNQNAFIGVSFDPFVTFRTQTENWKQFYVYVGALALLALVGGLLFYVPYCSIVAATLIVAVTIAFAAASGWHIGRTVKLMEKE